MKMHVLPGKLEIAPIATQVPELAPARIIEVEISQSLPVVSAVDDRTGQRYQRAICLVRLHTRPLGVVEFQFDEGELSPQQCAQVIWRRLQDQVNAHLQQEGLPPVTQLTAEGLPSADVPRCVEEREAFFLRAPFVSIIVPTHNRPDRLQKCLRSLLNLHYPDYEIIVVDNAPRSDATLDFIKQNYHDMARVRYVCEDRPGVSWARNRGMMIARGEILAFTDDDVVVDQYWLLELIRGFDRAEDVVSVTGRVFPLELETPAQFWYEEYGGSNWFQEDVNTSWWAAKHIFNLKEHRVQTPLYPYRAGLLGCSANMAVKATFLRSIGGFDPALGGNGPSRCGQDIAVLFKVIIQGHTSVYEPASLVFHLNRREYKELRKQIYNYGVGLTAYLTKNVLEAPLLIFDFVPRVLYSLFSHVVMRRREDTGVSTNATYPKELSALKRRGMLYGPLAYIQSRRMMHRLSKTSRLAKAHAPLALQKES